MNFKTKYYSKQLNSKNYVKKRSTTLNKWNYPNNDLFNLVIIIPNKLINKQLNCSIIISNLIK